MPDTDREREWLDAAKAETSKGLPRPDLNPLVNPVLGQNMGRWAEVYFTSPPEEREQAVEKLLQELQTQPGAKKAPTPNAPTDRAAAVPVRKAEPDFEPHELPMPQLTKIKREPAPVADHDLVVCPGCLHKNAAEQRFCGICGLSLTQEPVPPQTRPAAEQIRPARPPVQNPEADWQWLRQRNIREYEIFQEKDSSSRFLLGVIIVLVLAGGAYFALQKRGRSPHQQVPAASQPSSQTAQGSPSYNVNVPVQPSAAPRQVADTNANTPVPASANLSVPPPAASSPSAASPRSPSSATPASSSASAAPASRPGPSTTAPEPSENGRDELQQGLRYLQGDGVPKNSWVASQWLWKSVAKKNSDAVLLLSDLYARGDGVPRSCEQARILLIASAKRGSPAAAEKLRSVETSCR